MLLEPGTATEGTGSRERFELCFCADLAAAVGIHENRIAMMHVQGHPTVVRFRILPAEVSDKVSPREAAIHFKIQMADKRSRLLQGTVLRFIDPTIVPTFTQFELR